MGRYGIGSLVVVSLLGCATKQGSSLDSLDSIARYETAEASRGVVKADSAPNRAREAGTRFVDSSLGFEISRPKGAAWRFMDGMDAPDGIVVPVIVAHETTGAQVVVQIAPSVASPEEFALRLAEGLREKPGFSIHKAEPLENGGATFDFSMSDIVSGKVSIRAASNDRTFVLLATWPVSAPTAVVKEANAIVESLRPISPRASRTGL